MVIKSPTNRKKSTKTVLRFAHPFFTNVPLSKRKEVHGVGTRMNDFVKTRLQPIPTPHREPTMSLADIIGDEGVASIIKAKKIVFHSTGDTGDPKEDMQEKVTDAMSEDYNASQPDKSPAFFLHLGDVIYYRNNDVGYRQQFYEPYRKYPGKIIAVPGNHDGELFKYDGTPTGQKKSLEAFMNNFCQTAPSVPPAAGTIYREMVGQPGVYWILNTPFVDIIGLYSNVAEGSGFISSKIIGSKQKDWLLKTLKKISTERDKGNKRALIIAVHHPPFSNGGHGSSTAMLDDIDDCCIKSNIMPDAFLAGHSHCYQRYTRTVNKKQIPFIVAGCGGHNASPVKRATGQKSGDNTYDKSLKGYGYLTISVSKDLLLIQFIQVTKDKKQLVDKVKVDLTQNKIIR